MKTQVEVATKAQLSGWGRYPVVETLLLRPESVAAMAEYVAPTRLNTMIARGLGRSYGDAAVNGSGSTVVIDQLKRVYSFDEMDGIVRCEPGVTIEDLIAQFLPMGWFPLVVPGTKFVTLAGAIACDIHGKNHHRDGSFVNSVRSFMLVTAFGEEVTCSRENNPALFWATVGGMGLTGFITAVELKLCRVPSGFIKRRTFTTSNLDETLEVFERYEPSYQYSVAWIDCLAGRSKLGRGIVIFGNTAELSDLPRGKLVNPYAVEQEMTVGVGFDMPEFFLNKKSMGIFNECYWSSHLGRDAQTIVPYNLFYFPLDRLLFWNRLYGKNGFVQYQCVIPFEAGRENLVRILASSAKHGMSSFLCVLKRFGAEQGLLSFPKPGYTLTLDMPVRPGLFEFIAELNQLVLEAEGRVYLAKDSFLTAVQFQKMYPNYERWLAVKTKLDPEGIFRSALSDRLGLTKVK